MKSLVHPSQSQSVSTSNTHTRSKRTRCMVYLFSSPSQLVAYFLSSNGFSTYSSSSSSSLGRVGGGEFAFNSETGRFGNNPILAAVWISAFTTRSRHRIDSPAFTGLPLAVVGGLGTSPEGRGDAAGDGDAPGAGPVGSPGMGATIGGALRCAGGASRSYPWTGPRVVVEGPLREIGCSAAGLGSPA